MDVRLSLTGFQSIMRVLDWVLGAASLGYGLYAQSWIWIASGFIGFALAWYNPGARLRKRLAVVKPANATGHLPKR